MYVPPEEPFSGKDQHEEPDDELPPPPESKPTPRKGGRLKGLLGKTGKGLQSAFAPSRAEDEIGRGFNDAGRRITDRIRKGPVKFLVVYRNPRNPEAEDRRKGPFAKRGEAVKARKQLVKQGYDATLENV